MLSKSGLIVNKSVKILGVSKAIQKKSIIHGCQTEQVTLNFHRPILKRIETEASGESKTNKDERG